MMWLITIPKHQQDNYSNQYWTTITPANTLSNQPQNATNGQCNDIVHNLKRYLLEDRESC